MKTKLFKTVMACGCATALLGGTAAHAASVEPDDFASDTNISNSTPGVTLSAFGSIVSGTSDNVLAETADKAIISPGNIASTGTEVFGSVGPFADANFFGTGRSFRADFSGSINTVSLDFISNGPESTRGSAGDNSSGVLTAFDSGGTQLDQITAASITGGTFQTLTVNSGSDIAYITATSPSNDAATATIGLDNLVFNPGNGGNGGGGTAVPTPTAAAAGLVLMGGLFLRRRRRAA